MGEISYRGFQYDSQKKLLQGDLRLCLLGWSYNRQRYETCKNRWFWGTTPQEGSKFRPWHAWTRHWQVHNHPVYWFLYITILIDLSCSVQHPQNKKSDGTGGRGSPTFFCVGFRSSSWLTVQPGSFGGFPRHPDRVLPHLLGPLRAGAHGLWGPWDRDGTPKRLSTAGWEDRALHCGQKLL